MPIKIPNTFHAFVCGLWIISMRRSGGDGVAVDERSALSLGGVHETRRNAENLEIIEFLLLL